METPSPCPCWPKKLQIWALLSLATIVGLMGLINSMELRKTLVFLVKPSTTTHRNSSMYNVSYPGTSDLVPMKTILFWTTFFGSKDFHFGFGQQPFHRLQCSVSNCETTDNKSLINSSDAVIFHIRDLGKNMPYHNPQQRWVFFLMESPAYTGISLQDHYNVFNWTMTYRLDSDILLPYGTFTEKSAEEKERSAKGLSENHAIGRTKMVSWLVSHCITSSKRELLAKELSKHIEVHIYGGCGKPCDKLCAEKLKKEYKFFLAFENSLCKDYVTEKFFRIADEGMGIPVVFGGGNYSRIAPPKSYIDARSFRTPKDLANYLLVVAGDDKLYNEYFEWRSHFRLAKWAPYCDLCKLLHEDLPPKTYKDIQHWWVSLGHCEQGYSIHSDKANVHTKSRS